MDQIITHTGGPLEGRIDDGHGGYKPLASLSSGQMIPAAAAALLALHHAVIGAGSVHRVTDGFRSIGTQTAAREIGRAHV